MKNFALFIVTITISFLIMELFLRLAGYPPRQLKPNRFFVDNSETTWSIPDQDVGWVNKSGVSLSIEDGNAPMTFWSYGRRASRKFDKFENYYLDIMLSGGSNAQSYGVEDEKTFAFLLGNTFPGVRFENFGTGGYGTVQSYLLAKRTLKSFYINKKPDLIILTISDSHFNRNVSDYSWMRNISDKNGYYVSPPHYRLKNDEVEFYPFKVLRPWVLETYSSILTLSHFLFNKYISYNTSMYSKEMTLFALQKFQEVALQNQSDFLVLILEDYTGKADFLLKTSGINYLNCSGFEKTNPKLYLLGGGSHPNHRFHKHYAKCLEVWIRDNYKITD